MTTLADCNAGICPCSRSERPPANHQCPTDDRSFDTIEAERHAQLNRPFEEDEGVRIEWP